LYIKSNKMGWPVAIERKGGGRKWKKKGKEIEWKGEEERGENW
jgi:hypothetical protein